MHVSASPRVPLTALVALILFPVLTTGQVDLPPSIASDVMPVSFVAENGWEYDGRIELPAEGKRNGWGVMLLGGGLGSPIDWEIPGIMTLDGQPTRDADTIARALLDAGFTVMRWHSIRRGDPIRAKDPLMMDPPTFPQTVDQARKAFDAFREKNVVPVERMFLLGHSLGARRAAILIDEHPSIPGVVMLAGASLLASDLEKAKSIVSKARADAASANPVMDPTTAALRALSERLDDWKPAASTDRDRHGHRWAADVLLERRTPLLAIVGELDERWYLEALLLEARMRKDGRERATFTYLAGLGHQLGPEVTGDVTHPQHGVIAASRTGPIEPRVVREIVAWLNQQAKTGRN